MVLNSSIILPLLFSVREIHIASYVSLQAAHNIALAIIRSRAEQILPIAMLPAASPAAISKCNENLVGLQAAQFPCESNAAQSVQSLLQLSESLMHLSTAQQAKKGQY